MVHTTSITIVFRQDCAALQASPFPQIIIPPPPQQAKEEPGGGLFGSPGFVQELLQTALSSIDIKLEWGNLLFCEKRDHNATFEEELVKERRACCC